MESSQFFTLFLDLDFRGRRFESLVDPDLAELVRALNDITAVTCAVSGSVCASDVLPILSVVTNSYGFQFLTASGHQGRARIGSLGQRLPWPLVLQGGVSFSKPECRAARRAGAEQERAWEGAAGVSEDASACLSKWNLRGPAGYSGLGSRLSPKEQSAGGQRLEAVGTNERGEQDRAAVWAEAGAGPGPGARGGARVCMEQSPSGVPVPVQGTAESSGVSRSGEAGRAWRKKRGRRVRVQAVGAGAAAGAVTADEQECGRRAGAQRQAGVREEQERCRAGSIVQYHVFYTTQYQTIFDDKKYLWSPILAPSSTVWHRVVLHSIGRVDFCYSNAPRYWAMPSRYPVIPADTVFSLGVKG
ncbi:hypothetical protein B0H14DRAFT_2614241 [Mycena olivaceomarginata]|nr:hypothetical protein B0H14DRAFT_2614241 [Mycena olivaceomarginata]